jgi:Bacterial SH3 domain
MLSASHSGKGNSMSRIPHKTLQDIAHLPPIPNVFTVADEALAHLHGARDLALKLAFPLDQELAKARAQFSAIESLVASSLKGPAEELANLQDRFRSIIRTSNVIGESHGLHGLEEVKRQADLIAETFQKSFASTFAIQESFHQTLVASLGFQKELGHLLPHSLEQELNKLTQFAATLPALGISVSPEGILSIGNESVPIDDMWNDAEELFDQQAIRNLPEFLHQLFAKAKGFSPSLRALFVVIVLHIVLLTRDLAIELFAPYVNEYLVEHGHLSRREVTKAINKNVTQQIPGEILRDFRFVKIAKLKVRESPSTNSPQVGVVHLSEVVRVVKEKKDWTLVECGLEDSEVLIRGWVYTRYLAKFKTRRSPTTVGPEQLGQLERDEPSAQFDKDFLQAAHFVLEKNEELYRRLA